MSHYSEPREQWYSELRQEETFQLEEEGLVEGTYASLPSLEGFVELGKGKDQQESKEAYLENIESLIQELNEKRVKIMYDLVSLDYTVVKEEVLNG